MYAHCGCTLFCSVQPLSLLFFTLLPPDPIFQQLLIYILISSTFTSYVLWFHWCSIILFSFPSFPEFHTVFPLLQTYSTSEFAVYDHACFYVYAYLLDLSSIYERKDVVFVFLNLANFTWCPAVASIYLQTTCHYSLWLNNSPLHIHTTCLDPLINCRAPGLFP
jgi:hypothetical protein